MLVAAGGFLEQGFAPRLSRVAAGISFLLFVGALQYFFGRWVMYGVLFFPVLLSLLLMVTIPRSARKTRIIRLVSASVDVSSFFMERLDDRFDTLVRRLKRQR
jgi:hypothetical protein